MNAINYTKGTIFLHEGTENSKRTLQLVVVEQDYQQKMTQYLKLYHSIFANKYVI